MSEDNAEQGLNSTDFYQVCPFLGLSSDPQSHISTVDPRNYCHLISPIRSVTGEHQNRFCLHKAHRSCNIYLDPENGSFIGEDHKGKEKKSRNGKKAWLGLAAVHSQESDQQNALVNSNGEYSSDEISVDSTGQRSYSESVVPINASVVASGQSRVNDEVASVIEDHVKSESIEDDMPADQNDLMNRLNNEAKSRYGNTTPPRSKIVWSFVLILSLFILVASIFGIYMRYDRLQRESQIASQEANAAVLATSIADMNQSANSVATAAEDLRLAQVRATEDTLALIALNQAEEEKSTAATMTALAVMPEESPTLGPCTDTATIGYELVSGPHLTPEPFFSFLRSRPPIPTSSWILKNTGSCIWENISFWSLLDGQAIDALIINNGEVINPDNAPVPILVSPGEQIEVAVKFRVDEARNVNEQFVVIVNGVSLEDLPHIDIQVEDWVIPVTRTPTLKASTQPKKATSAPPSARPTGTPPGNR
jgi:hypothetical protein